MTEVSEGSLPSNMSLEESETDCSEGHDEVVPGRIASSPLDPFPARDFRVKFKKMRQKKRPTILENVACYMYKSYFPRCPSPLSVLQPGLVSTALSASQRGDSRHYLLVPAQLLLPLLL
ncbi:hypothetical protein NQZ68_012937 [Dissostichus eleginoides]|nr:hypothetical protein NQZ68_012937 [Dissostichus eleginoides]